MAQRVASFETRVAFGVGSGLVGAAVTALGLLVLISARMTGILVVLFLAPILVAASWPAFVRQAHRERDPNLASLLLIALVLKLCGSLARYAVAIYVYEGSADAVMYHGYGEALAMRFRSGHFDPGLASLSGTDFIRFFTGVVYTVTGPSIIAGFLLYSWLAFWGMFYMYRTFTIAVPGGNRRSYARLLLFMPSMLYWPSSIGKEAWMLFALGLTAYGTARLLTGRTWRGLVLLGVGLWLATLVRPHVGGMAMMGVVAAYLLSRPPRRLGAVGPVVKLLALALLVVAAVMLLGRIQGYLTEKGIDPAEGVNSVLTENARRTSGGGSGFATTSSSTSPAKIPLATVTILFRPFPFEAHNAQSAITALESTVLLGLTIARRRAVWAALRQLRRRPYVAFIVVFTLGFVVAFASVSNFGILARERVQLLPLYLVLLAIPLPRPRPPARQVVAADVGRGDDAARQLARA
jgi:hypothetical protein